MSKNTINAIAFQVDLLKLGKRSRVDVMDELVELLSIEEVSLVVHEIEVEVRTPLYSMVFNKTRSWFVYK
jgi:hypothetical protein